MKNTIQNTSGTTRTAFGARRVVIGAASVVAAGALIGVGAQGAFAATGDTGAAGSGSATVSTSTPGASGSASAGGSTSFEGWGHGYSLFGQAHALFNGHINGAKAQALAKKIVADTPVFSLLPDSLQSDLKTLADASSQDRTADAKKVVSSALKGTYGTAVQKLAIQLKTGGETGADAEGKSDSQGGLNAAGIDIKGLISGLRSGDLLGSGSTGASQLTSEVSGIASTVTGDSQLASKLPDSLRTDLAQLSSAPADEQSADLQKIATTALSGGYGSQVQQVADQLEQAVTAAH